MPCCTTAAEPILERGSFAEPWLFCSCAPQLPISARHRDCALRQPRRGAHRSLASVQNAMAETHQESAIALTSWQVLWQSRLTMALCGSLKIVDYHSHPCCKSVFILNTIPHPIAIEYDQKLSHYLGRDYPLCHRPELCQTIGMDRYLDRWHQC